MSNSRLDFRASRAEKLKAIMRRDKITQAALAKISGYDEKTIRNLLAGKVVREVTAIQVCQALGLEPQAGEHIDNIELSDIEFGGYARSSYKSLEGFYHIYRRNFSKNGSIFRSVIEIFWDKSNKLVFKEYYSTDDETRKGNSFIGDVYISPKIGLVHLLIVNEGAVRLTTLTKLRDRDRIMRGSIQTQIEIGKSSAYRPTVSSIFLKKLDNYDVDARLYDDLDMIGEESPDYKSACRELKIVEAQIINMAFLSQETFLSLEPA